MAATDELYRLWRQQQMGAIPNQPPPISDGSDKAMDFSPAPVPLVLQANPDLAPTPGGSFPMGGSSQTWQPPTVAGTGPVAPGGLRAMDSPTFFGPPSPTPQQTFVGPPVPTPQQLASTNARGPYGFGPVTPRAPSASPFVQTIANGPDQTQVTFNPTASGGFQGTAVAGTSPMGLPGPLPQGAAPTPTYQQRQQQLADMAIYRPGVGYVPNPIAIALGEQNMQQQNLALQQERHRSDRNDPTRNPAFASLVSEYMGRGFSPRDAVRLSGDDLAQTVSAAGAAGAPVSIRPDSNPLQQAWSLALSQAGIRPPGGRNPAPVQISDSMRLDAITNFMNALSPEQIGNFQAMKQYLQGNRDINPQDLDRWLHASPRAGTTHAEALRRFYAASGEQPQSRGFWGDLGADLTTPGGLWSQPRFLRGWNRLTGR